MNQNKLFAKLIKQDYQMKLNFILVKYFIIC